MPSRTTADRRPPPVTIGPRRAPRGAGLGAPLPVLLAILLAILLTACSSARMSGLEQSPRVHLVDVEPVKLGLFEQRFVLTLRVQNPNRVPLAIRGLEYRIALNDEDFASGVSRQALTIPAYGETLLELGVSSSVASVLRQLKALGERDGRRVTYDIEGSVGVADLGISLPFRQFGELGADGRPRS